MWQTYRHLSLRAERSDATRNREHKGICETNDNMSTMLRINRDKCGYCGTCVAVCPEDALELIDAYLSLERECIACGICARACPFGALEVVHEE